MRDTSRQWAESEVGISRDHVARYRFALKHVTGRTLDAACGCGYGSKILLESASSVVGVDASEEAIAWARNYFSGPQFILGRIERAPWEGSFETIVSLETIEHIREPREALEAFRRACTGKLIASVPNENLYPFKAETFARDDSPHFRHYTPEEFQSLLEDAGFTVTGKFCQRDKRQFEVIPGTEGRFMVFVCE